MLHCIFLSQNVFWVKKRATMTGNKKGIKAGIKLGTKTGNKNKKTKIERDTER